MDSFEQFVKTLAEEMESPEQREIRWTCRCAAELIPMSPEMVWGEGMGGRKEMGWILKPCGKHANAHNAKLAPSR